MAALYARIAEHATEPDQVALGIETDEGMWVASLISADYQIYAINPMVAAHYRDCRSHYRLGRRSTRFGGAFHPVVGAAELAAGIDGLRRRPGRCRARTRREAGTVRR